MLECLCNTSPLQYLYQINWLSILPVLAGPVIIPPAVVAEIEVGRRLGLGLPDLTTLSWITVHQPQSQAAIPEVAHLGAGEASVLMLALESSKPVVILDDALARRTAKLLNIPMKGTLGLLIDAKRAGLILAIEPVLNELQQLGFRLASTTRVEVLRMANELSP